MSFGVTATIVGSLAVAGATVYAGYTASEAAKSAANTQSNAAQSGIDEQRRQFDKVHQLLQPYVDAGKPALTQQQDIAGLNGVDAQNKAIDAIKNGGEFSQLVKSGESSIMQNAAATGGLRGGNTQAALAQFSPQILSSLVDKQYGRLSGLSQMGENAAAGVGQAGQASANQVSSLLEQQGAAQAGGQIAAGQAGSIGLNAILAGLGTYTGLKGKF